MQIIKSLLECDYLVKFLDHRLQSVSKIKFIQKKKITNAVIQHSQVTHGKEHLSPIFISSLVQKSSKETMSIGYVL